MPGTTVAQVTPFVCGWLINTLVRQRSSAVQGSRRRNLSWNVHNLGNGVLGVRGKRFVVRMPHSIRLSS